MAIQAKQREDKAGFQLEVGLLQATPVAFNPSREELEQLLGKELEKDPEYLSEDEDGIARLRLDVWCKEVETEKLHKIQIWLKNKRLEFDAREGVADQRPTKIFVNSKGFVAYAKEEEELPAYFVKDGVDVHQGFEGEPELLNLISSVLFVENISLDWKKLMKGNVKELREILTMVRPAILVAGVRTDRDGKDWQSYYNSKFLPATSTYWSQLASGKYTEAYINKLREKSTQNAEARNAGEKAPHKLSQLEYFVLNVTDPKRGFRDFYGKGLLPLHAYDAIENIAATDTVATIEEDDNDSSF